MAANLRFPVIPCQRYSVTESRYKFVMGIGRRLKERRKELKLRVEDVARQAGMRPSTLYDLEREEQHSTTRLHALCEVLGLNAGWVESGKGVRLAGESRRVPLRVAEEQPRYTLHGMQITPEEVEFGIEWGKLDEPARSLIRQQVLLMVAEQVRAKRRSRQKEPDPKPNHNR
jgi:transcriptional regulator with XRE-family HTH domain